MQNFIHFKFFIGSNFEKLDTNIQQNFKIMLLGKKMKNARNLKKLFFNKIKKNWFLIKFKKTTFEKKSVF